MWARWRHLANIIELMLPSTHLSPQPKRKISRFRGFCTAHGKKIAILCNGWPFPQNCPVSWGIWTPSNTWLLGHIWAHNPNGVLIDSAVFAQMTAEYPYTLQWDAPFSLKIAHSHGGSGPPSNTWFPGPTRVLNRNGISIGSAFLQGSLVWQTDRQTTLLCW